MTSVSANNERTLNERTLAAAGDRRAGFGVAAALGDRAGRSVLWMAGAVITLVLAATAILIHSLRENALDAAEVGIVHTNFMLAATLERTFQTIDLTMAATADAIAAGTGGKGSVEERRDWLRSRIAGLPAAQRLSFSDASGRVIGSSQNSVLTATSIGDRSYFAALRDRSAPEPVVSEPIQSRADGQWTFILARRITGADGGFLGAVWTTVNLDALDRLFAAVAPEPGARVTLLRKDMMMLARRPYVPGLLGESMASTATFAGIFADGRTAGSGRFYSTPEHRDRVAAAARLERYPFVISVAVPESTILAPWRQLAIGLGTASLAVVGGLAALFRVVHRQGRRLRAGAAALSASETALGEERERLSSVVEASSDGFWEWHLDTGMVDWSERCCALMGMPAAGGVLHFEQVVEMVAPEDRERYRQAVRRHFDDGRPFAIEARWRAFDGGIRWMASRGRLIAGADGRPSRMVGANTDITERKLLESGFAALDGED